MDLGIAAPAEFAGAQVSDFQIVTPQTEQQVAEQAPEQAPVETPQQPTVQEPIPQQQPEQQPATQPETKTTPEPEKPAQQPITIEQPKQHEPFLQKPEAKKPWEEVLKENGFDDFGIGVLKYYKETGDVAAYAEVKSVNYKDMSAEEIMRRDLRQQYPGLSEENFKRLYRKQVIDKYTLDPDQNDPEDVSLGKEMLEQDANEKRQKFLERQAQFTAPERQPDDSAQRQQEAYQQQQEAFKQTIHTDTATQQLLRDKRLVLDGGEAGFQYTFEAANPQDVVDVLLDGEKYTKLITRPDGKPDVQKMLLLGLVAKDPQLVIKSLINYGKSLGSKQLVTTELQNADSREHQGVHQQQEETLSDAFFNRGKQSWQQY